MTLQRNNAITEAAPEMTVPEGYVPLGSTVTYFDMDLVGKNLQMNSVDAVWFYPDLNEHPADRPTLYVRSEQKELALDVISSLDLTDFIITHGK